MNSTFWLGKRVFVTGHTGFKGAWLSLWLQMLGAKVTGYSLSPTKNQSLFDLASVGDNMKSIIADIRNLEQLSREINKSQPEIVFHLAAQPLVHESYRNPVHTYEVNVIGVANLMESIRTCPSIRSVVNVTTDKCYENKEWYWGYREIDPLGGYDPYSNSKACAELVTSAFRNSYFNPDKYSDHNVAIATARAGNVIGGGDWSDNRLVPDVLNAIYSGKTVEIRNPHSIRPWQHVLEPISGYLLLAEKLMTDGASIGGAYNFGPNDEDARSVEYIVSTIIENCGFKASWNITNKNFFHEANYLKLDCSKSKEILNWHPKWNLEKALKAILFWHNAYKNNENLRDVCKMQIEEFLQ